MEAWLLPPGGLVLLTLAGLLLVALRRRRAAAVCMAFAAVSLYLLSTPLISHALMNLTQPFPALAAPLPNAQAIVVLAAGRNRDAPEYGGDTISMVTLERVRYGARLHRLTGLPLLVSGGSPFQEGPPLAVLMAQALREDFRVEPVWLEDKSTTTWENASFSARLLRAKGVTRILLVSHAWHLPRARRAFEAAGLAVIPAPTGFEKAEEKNLALSLAPSSRALHRSYWALHELLGTLWYGLRY